MLSVYNTFPFFLLATSEYTQHASLLGMLDLVLQLQISGAEIKKPSLNP